MRLFAILFFAACSLGLPDLESEFLHSDDMLTNLSIDYWREMMDNFAAGANRQHFLDTYVKVSDHSTITYDKEMLVIDFGGSFLKCGIYALEGKTVKPIHPIEQYPLPKRWRNSTKRADCFEWMAFHIDYFLRSKNYCKALRAGMTFSHPVNQTSIRSGTILSLGKDFPFKNIDITKENDPVKLLNKELQKRKVPVVVDVLLNDATATLASILFTGDRQETFSIGIILGTGTNAAYVDHIFCKKPRIINTEWASFDSLNLNVTPCDERIEEMVKEEGKVYKRLDCMVGGYQFANLINIMCERENITKRLKLDDILRIVEECETKSFISDQEMFICKCYEVLKKRNAQILVTLVLSLIKSQAVQPSTMVEIAINGSQFSNPKELRFFEEELKRQCATSLYKYENFRFIPAFDATLTGTLKVLALQHSKSGILEKVLKCFSRLVSHN
ncbi:Hexokinase [Trachipleistophora hominis]|uniref:Phosphotransferase n=1 Tax=Trachipleistophora hominis TaxID=72359 RepID=L7JZB5_TRAHO|nr:Hexokinase [Trachipleistophora hominis]